MNYSVIVSNSFGSVTSSIVSLTVTGTLPSFTIEPTNQTVSAGDDASFSSLAAGDPPPAYHWQLNGTNIAGGTNTVLIIHDAQDGNAGPYTIIASNIVGAATSSVATLTVQ